MRKLRHCGTSCTTRLPLAAQLKMGVEYKIRFSVPSDGSLDRVLAQLPDASIEDSSWTEFDVKVEADGIYFCDNLGRPEVAAIAFKRLVDTALGNSDEVVIEEL